MPESCQGITRSWWFYDEAARIPNSYSGTTVSRLNPKSVVERTTLTRARLEQRYGRPPLAENMKWRVSETNDLRVSHHLLGAPRATSPHRHRVIPRHRGASIARGTERSRPLSRDSGTQYAVTTVLSVTGLLLRPIRTLGCAAGVCVQEHRCRRGSPAASHTAQGALRTHAPNPGHGLARRSAPRPLAFAGEEAGLGHGLAQGPQGPGEEASSARGQRPVCRTAGPQHCGGWRC